MLSRRLLRIKAVQHLYSYCILQRVNKLQGFEEDRLRREDERDLVRVKSSLQKDIQTIEGNVLRFLNLLGRSRNHISEYESNYSSLSHLKNNVCLAQLRNVEAIQKVPMSCEPYQIQQWVVSILKKAKESVELVNLHSAKQNGINSYEQDKQSLYYLMRDGLMKSKLLQEFTEQGDYMWTENKPIIRNILKKYIKRLSPDTVPPPPALCPDWQTEYIDFYKRLFEVSVTQGDTYLQWIEKYADGWSSERFFLIDKVIMKIALVEFIHFANIPVKTTLNEYIEIAKIYSTSQSNRFVNGMLGKAVEELEKQNKICKTARGSLG